MSNLEIRDEQLVRFLISFFFFFFFFFSEYFFVSDENRNKKKKKKKRKRKTQRKKIIKLIHKAIIKYRTPLVGFHEQMTNKTAEEEEEGCENF